MANSLGVHRHTLEPLTDWSHVVQSVIDILTTPLGTRVMRRDYGSELPDLVDQAITPANILRLYMATYIALVKWEPRLKVVSVNLDEASADARVSLIILCQYLPRGHLGDFTPASGGTRKITVTFV